MIVATAGHVDHGKTSLVRALTGVETDRLEEEKRRGMSIDLGFAYADLGGAAPTGFVDVPGHERFVRNMLAGVAAIDFALVVIAADDGPMPQTFEHLAILGLLGVAQGAVALTKVDRVDAQRLREVRAEIEAALAPTPLRESPLFEVAPPLGLGVEALRTHLARAEQGHAARACTGNFRLAIDRGFMLDGAGLVVTGAVFSGETRVGDSLLVSPVGVEVRVRSIHSQGRPAERARTGERCAINLAGADLRRIEPGRGDWLVAPAAHAPTDRLDAQLELLLPEGGAGSGASPSGGRTGMNALEHWSAVRLHIGSGAIDARVALLESHSMSPGSRGLVQLVTQAPIAALRGDRFVLRDVTARHTIGGGRIVDPFGIERGRRSPERLAHLRAMALPDPRASLAAVLAAAPAGLRLDRFLQAWNLTPSESATLLGAVPTWTFEARGQTFALSRPREEELVTRLTAMLASRHAAEPESLGMSGGDLATAIGGRHPEAAAAVLAALVAQGRVVRDGPFVRLSSHHPRLRPEDEALMARLLPLLEDGGLRPPIVGDVARALAMTRDEALERLERLAHLGHLVRVAPNRFYPPQAVAALAGIAAELAAESPDGSFDAAAYRDRSGIGRNLTIEVLEFLDRSGVTRFARERRRMAGR
ncbi:MAG: hypothetical protein RIS35_150 [Pseudomonadota bacterium]